MAMNTPVESSVSILQRLSNVQDRNNIIWKWVHEKKIPITHPNSMNRILREAKNGTLKNMDWRRESTVQANFPWTPEPRSGSMYTKGEMITILSKMCSSDRNKLVRRWVHEKKIPFTSSLAANNAVIKAIRGQKQEEEASSVKGVDIPKRMNSQSAIAATGPPRKKQKYDQGGHINNHTVE
jgi:hypothetical protein